MLLKYARETLITRPRLAERNGLIPPRPIRRLSTPVILDSAFVNTSTEKKEDHCIDMSPLEKIIASDYYVTRAADGAGKDSPIQYG